MAINRNEHPVTVEDAAKTLRHVADDISKEGRVGDPRPEVLNWTAQQLEVLVQLTKTMMEGKLEDGSIKVEQVHEVEFNLNNPETGEEIDGFILTAEQVVRLNGLQTMGNVHPMTCPHRDDGEHAEFNGDLGGLVATRFGWICVFCGYAQPTTPQPFLNMARESH